MLFMVVERFKDQVAVAQRFQRQGRMLPSKVIYHVSWMQSDGARCFQLMEAPDRISLDTWIARWSDLVEFEVTPVLTSSEYWQERTTVKPQSTRPGS